MLRAGLAAKCNQNRCASLHIKSTQPGLTNQLMSLAGKVDWARDVDGSLIQGIGPILLHAAVAPLSVYIVVCQDGAGGPAGAVAVNLGGALSIDQKL